MADLSSFTSGVASLDETGLNQVLPAYARQNVKAIDVADQFVADPKAFIAHAFALTAVQQRGLAALPDAELAKAAVQVSEVLRTTDSQGVSFTLNRHSPSGGGTPTPQALCKHIQITINPKPAGGGGPIIGIGIDF